MRSPECYFRTCPAIRKLRMSFNCPLKLACLAANDRFCDCWLLHKIVASFFPLSSLRLLQFPGKPSDLTDVAISFRFSMIAVVPHPTRTGWSGISSCNFRCRLKQQRKFKLNSFTFRHVAPSDGKQLNQIKFLNLKSSTRDRHFVLIRLEGSRCLRSFR